MSARRAVLKAGLIGVPAVAALGVGGLGLTWAGADLDTAGRTTFANRLAIPPVAKSYLDGAGHKVFDLVAGTGEHRFRNGHTTRTWGFNGAYLGPTLRLNRGETVLVNVRNELAEVTSVHWHGMHLPAAMDGGPHQPIKPGSVWSPSWHVDQPAGTLWYHPHPHEHTARHTYRGLAGLLIVDDENVTPSGLPHRYGFDDIPLILQDKRFTHDNRLDEKEPMFSSTGLLGDVICVNGTTAPFHDVTTDRVRMRILNASNARVYSLGLDDSRTFTLLGTDGGLLAEPLETERIPLSPGERADIVVHLRPDERVVLRSYPPDLGTGWFQGRFAGGHDTLDILELRAGSQLTHSLALPRKLAEPPRLHQSKAAITRRFEISGYSINGRRIDMHRIDFESTAGTVEHWVVVNRDDVPHNFHVHDVQFQVLSVGGSQPPPHLSGWKDTIYTPPGVELTLALRFADHTDHHTPYMFHCHLLQHEDRGMMGQFVVVAPGQHGVH